MTPEEKIADKRLRKKYGISLQEYDQMLREQNGVCKICNRPPGKVRLSVDHDHKIEKWKIEIVREIDDSYWIAAAMPYVLPYGGYHKKSEARQFIKQMLKRRSVRGILCWRCNSGLQKYSDIAERFDAAARYLREFQSRSLSEQKTRPNENPSPSISPAFVRPDPGGGETAQEQV